MGTCCNSDDISGIKLSQSKFLANSRISFNKDENVIDNNNIIINITTNGANPISMLINKKCLFSEVKKKYYLLAKKSENDIIVFVYKGKTIDENESLNSLGINENITIAAFDSNDYKI